jgi:hypothetical protein
MPLQGDQNTEPNHMHDKEQCPSISLLIHPCVKITTREMGKSIWNQGYRELLLKILKTWLKSLKRFHKNYLDVSTMYTTSM